MHCSRLFGRATLGAGLVTAASCLMIPAVSAQDINASVEVSATRSFVPLQSYGVGEIDGCIVFFGGLSGLGLHQFAANAFPANAFNTEIVVVDKADGTVTTGSTNHLPAAIREALIMTAPSTIQFGDMLYLYGGYGPAIVESDLTTRDTVTAIDLGMVKDAILSAQNVPAGAFNVMQSDAAQVAGAGIVKFSDGDRFALVCGANTVGDYGSTGIDPHYSDEVRIFDRTVSMTTPVLVMNDGLEFDSPMHRRDVNVLPVTLPGLGPSMRDGFVVAAGAFENGIFLHDNPLLWGDGDAMPTEIPMIQNSGAYEGPAVSLYSVADETNYMLMLSGLSFFELDGNDQWIQNYSTPWTDDVTLMQIVDGIFIDDGGGNLSTPLGKMPWPLTNAKVVIEDGIPTNAQGQILVDDLPCHTPVLIGRIYGGIAADFPGDQPPTSDSDAVLDLYITVGPTGTPALMKGIDVFYGSIVAGGVAEASVSDGEFFQMQSQIGFAASDPIFLRVQFRFVNQLPNPATLDIVEEARIDNPGGKVRLDLWDYNAKRFDGIAVYPIDRAEQVVRQCDIPAADYVRSGDNQVRVRIQHSVLATFSPFGFQTSFDMIGVDAFPAE